MVKSDISPPVPFLGVNFRQSSSEVTWKNHLNPPPEPTPRRRKPPSKPQEHKGNRLSLVSMGLDIQRNIEQRPKLQAEKILAWANKHRTLEKREEKGKSESVAGEGEMRREVTPQLQSARKEIRAEDIYDFLSPIEPVEQHPSVPILHISYQPHAGFLHGVAPTTSKFPRQQVKVKRREAKSVNRISLLSGHRTFEIPLAEPCRELASERRPERHKAVGVPLIPKGTPLYRIPVDYNIFRNVYKHRERPPRTAGSHSSPNLREGAKGM